MKAALVLAFVAFVAAQQCAVETTGFIDFCSNGEVCTSVGCRCVNASVSCFHTLNHTFCGALNTCPMSDGSRQCCRSGESCVSGIGCRCASTDCAPPRCTGDCLAEASNSIMPKTMMMKMSERLECWRSGHCQELRSAPTLVGATVPCVGGFAAGYPCQNVDLYAHLDFDALGCNGISANAEGNDIWGWSRDGRDFAIAGCTNGVSFVEITDPVNPLVLGVLPTQSTSTVWRDMKVFEDHAFIVSEARNHGMQVFDLRRLLSLTPDNTRKFTADAVYFDQMGTTTQRSTHNIAINEATGRAFLVGCKTCSGGLLMVDISNPVNPIYAGCYAGDGYTHDAQCVVYPGPNHEFIGREICFGFNEDSLTLVDTTDPAKPAMLSRIVYKGVAYTHQGWATEDFTHLFLDDELDEIYDTYDTSKRTNTYIWNIENLLNPIPISVYQSPVQSIDHNQYIYGRCSYQANYASGLRIVRLSDDLETTLPTQAAFFDVHPEADVAEFYGSWSVFANYKGANEYTVVVQSIEQGLFVLHVDKKAIGCY